MSGFIAGIALQQLRDMEQLQRDFGSRRTRRQRRKSALDREALAREATELSTVPRDTRRTLGATAPSPKSIMQ